MKGGYAKCSITSRSAWQRYEDVNIKGLDNLEAINMHNIENWMKITGTNKMPKMLKLSWNEIGINRQNKKKDKNPSKDYIPEEFILFYNCDYLRPKNSNSYSRKDLMCKKYGLYGWSKGNKTTKGFDNENDEPDYLNNLSCKDPCIKYKKCYGYNCCNVYNKYSDRDELVYCEACKKVKSSVIAFNLFEIMRQLLVAKCAIGKKNLLPYILNPVTQKPFSEDELNNFSYIFTRAVSRWKQNTNISKSFLRKNAQIVTNYVSPALLVTSLLLVPGGQAAAIISLMSSLAWTVGYIENIENVWELEKMSGNFKKGNKEYILASSKVVLASAEALIFSLVNIGFAKEGYTRMKSLGNSTISGPLLKKNSSGISSELLNFMTKVNLFDYGIPYLTGLSTPVTGEILHGQIRNIAFSGFGGLIYKMNKLKAVSEGKIKPNSFDQFDYKLNSIIINEQELRAKQLPINKDFLDNSKKNPFIKNFCNILGTTIERFKKTAKIKKINRTLKKRDDQLTHFQRISKNIILDIDKKRKHTSDAAGGGTNFYNKIVNPLTGRKVSIYGRIGKQILKNYTYLLN